MKATKEIKPATTTQSQGLQAQPQRRDFIAPDVNIFETEDGYVLEADMPGVSKEGLEITLEGTEMTITGHRNSHYMRGNALLRESRPADFQRVFELDPAIDTGKISARMEQGELILTLPKSERVKPRKITVS